jgi:hypothetical protein
MGNQHAGGAGIQDPLDGRRPELIHAYQGQQALGGGSVHELVGGADVDGGMFLVDDDEIVTGMRQNLDRLDGRQFDPGAYGPWRVKD